MTPSPLVNALDSTIAAIARYDRPDLDERLRQARARLLDGRVRVLVVGEFKQGKSFLVNALVQAVVCPVHDDIATSVPTVVSHDAVPSVTLVRPADAEADSRVEHVDVPIAKLEGYVREASDAEQRYSYVEVGLPCELLAGGLEIVDTPGVGGLNSVHGAATMAALPSADAVLLVSDASQEYTAPELEFLRQAIRLCPNVACVLTKIDLHPEWRRIAELDRVHLKVAGMQTELFALSSTARWAALQSDDRELDAESGFPALIRFLRQRVMDQADVLARRSTCHDIIAVTGQLIDGLRSEQRAQQNPETAQELIAELTGAQHRSAALKERSARWQHTLNDGVADLNADIEFDLRDRMREIVRIVEDEIDSCGDPKNVWDQISSWVEQQAATAASENFVWATERARWLAELVAGHFSEEREEMLPDLRTEAPDALSSVREMALRDPEPWNFGQKALTGMRGSYIGILMFGLLGTFVGLSVINPFSIGAGLVLGGKSISDERRRIISRRKNEGRQAVRRYADDAMFQVGKDSRDMLRQVQRDLRDHFTAQAEQMNRSLQDAVRGAERSLKSTKADRDRRMVEIRAELERLTELRQQARTLVGPGQPAAKRAVAPREEAPAELAR